ncbi:RNA polymerase sigma factor [Planctomycetota bacterium]|nr:RNA polymerase sigma factor [Planctomycetota bacterium]
MDDETLQQLELAIGGDVAAFGYVASAYRVALRSWCREAVGPMDADDVAQDALLLAFQKLGSLKEPKAFAGWLRQLVRTAADRHRRRRRPDLLDEEMQTAAPEVEEATEMLVELKGAVKELTEYQRHAIEQHYMRGLSVKEIAARVGVPQGTIKRRLFDAREKLRVKLAGLNRPNDAADFWRD